MKKIKQNCVGSSATRSRCNSATRTKTDGFYFTLYVGIVTKQKVICPKIAAGVHVWSTLLVT
jgi:hypothetical protein